MTLSLPAVRKPFNYGLALLAGAIQPLAFSPFDFWLAAPLSICLLLFCLPRCSIKQAAMVGWYYGVGFFGVGVSWVYVSIHEFGAAPAPLAFALTLGFVCGLALFFAIHLSLWRWLFPRAQTLGLLLGFPAFWVLAEWFRTWFLTGFPWILSGYATLDTPLSGWAPVLGVYGLSFCLALMGVALYFLVNNLRRSASKVDPSLIAFALSAPIFTGALLTTQQWTQLSTAAPVSTTLIQGNTEQNLKWLPENRAAIIKQYMEASLEHTQEDLIIWPETAVPNLSDLALPKLQPFVDYLDEQGVGLITGIPSRVVSHTTQAQPTGYYNSVIGLAQAEGVYHKQRLVPFGEYVPLENWLRGLIAFFDLPMSSFSLGSDDQEPIKLKQTGSTNPIKIPAYICYEIVYPDLVAKQARDSGFLLTVSNDSWFGNSLAPHQHLQMARLRALENGRSLVRATNNGISAFIDAKGEIQQHSPQFIRTTLTNQVAIMTGNTPFNHFRSWPILLLSAALVVIFAARARATAKP